MAGKSVEDKVKDRAVIVCPSLKNVSVDDYLVCVDGGKIHIASITETSCKRVWGGGKEFYYTDAVVLKRDGKYLIGKNVSREKV